MKIGKIMDVAYSIGAAIVVYGAWAKITHQHGANFFLTLGLLTEVFIFTVYGLREAFEGKTPEQQIAEASGVAVDNTELTSSMSELNNTVKRAFNLK